MSTSQAGLRGVLAPAPTPKAVALHVLQEAAHELVAIASCAIVRSAMLVAEGDTILVELCR